MYSYKLTYFNIRGRGELARLVFAAANIQYEDDRIDRKDWPAVSPNTPQGHLPVLTVNDKIVIPQSIAIVGYLAREFGLAGKSNLQQAYCDVVVQTAVEMRELWIRIFFEKDASRKAEMTQTFHTTDLPNYLRIFESMLESNHGGGGYFVGESVTVADLAVYDLFEILVAKNPELFSGTPKLSAHRKRVAEIPEIKAYLAKRPVTEM